MKCFWSHVHRSYRLRYHLILPVNASFATCVGSDNSVVTIDQHNQAAISEFVGVLAECTDQPPSKLIRH